MKKRLRCAINAALSMIEAHQAHIYYSDTTARYETLPACPLSETGEALALLHLETEMAELAAGMNTVKQSLRSQPFYPPASEEE